MKIQYASDLHLEFHENSRWRKDNPLLPVGDILVLAGDIGYLGDENYNRHPFWDWCAENFRQTIVIPGNHELYKSFDINELHEGWELNIRPNVKAVYNCVIPISKDIELIASTLWAKIPPHEEFQTERGVTDFHRIRNGQFRLSAQRFNQEHEMCREFIERSVAESNAHHVIVATHHVPSFALMADEFKRSPINGAFTELYSRQSYRLLDIRSFTSKHKQNNRQYPVYLQSAWLRIPRRADQLPPGCHYRN